MKKLLPIYLIANCIGVLLYLVFVWNIISLAQMEQRNFYDGVDGVTYFTATLPVLLFCFLLNVGWGIRALIDVFRRRDYLASIALAVVVAVWTACFLLVRFVV